MGWIFSLFLFISGLVIAGRDGAQVASLYFVAAGLFAIAGSIAFKIHVIKFKETEKQK